MTSSSTEIKRLRILGYATIVGLVVTFLVWGTWAQLNGAVIASGALEVSSYRQIVQHQEGGRVETLLVSNGAQVNVGDVLMTLDGGQIRPEYEIYNRQYMEALAEKGRLIAERDQLSAPAFPEALIELAKTASEANDIMESQIGLFEYRKEANAREIELLGERDAQALKQIEGSQSELDALDSQVISLNVELERNRKLLSQGIVGKGAVAAIERQLASFEGSEGKLESTIASVKDEQSAIKIELLKLTAKPREEAIARLRELENQEVEIFQRRASAAEQLSKLEIQAPVVGTVYGMSVYNANTVIGAGEPLMYIVPDGQPLIVRAQIAAADINDLYVGQDSELKFPAFNQRLIPYVGGVVKNISADAFTDEQTGFRYYEIEVQPEDEIISKLGAERLTPGQPVEVFVHTGSRSFLDYLLKPLKDNFARAFRED